MLRGIKSDTSSAMPIGIRIPITKLIEMSCHKDIRIDKRLQHLDRICNEKHIAVRINARSNIGQKFGNENTRPCRLRTISPTAKILKQTHVNDMTNDFLLDIDSLGEAVDARDIVAPRWLVDSAVEDVDYERVCPPPLRQA